MRTAVKLLLLQALCAACATGAPRPVILPGTSLLPTAVDYESLLPPAPPEVTITSKGIRFDDLPLNGGTLCPKAGKTAPCVDIQPGILVDETVYAQSIADHSSVKRLRIETKVLKELRTKERAAIATAEQAYQTRLQALETENATLRTPSWWQQHQLVVGFFTGAAAAVAVAYAAAHAAR